MWFLGCLARRATGTGVGELGQEKGLEEQSGGGTGKRFHLEDELDDLYSLEDGEKRLVDRDCQCGAA